MIAPSWVYPGAKIDLDFRNKRYWGGYVGIKNSAEDGGDMLTASAATAAFIPYTPTRSGVLYQGLHDQNRITDLGLFVERSSKNNCLWCRDLTNGAWVDTSSSAVKNQVGADGTTNAASLITASAIGGTVLQSITITSAAVIFSAYIKRVTGTGTVSITSDGVTYTDVTSQLSTAGYTWVQNPVQTLTAVVCGFQLGTSGDAIAVDFCQLEPTNVTGNLATTPMITTTVAVSRTNETQYASTGNSISFGNNGQIIFRNIFSYGGPHTCMVTFNGDCTTSTANGGPAMIATDWTAPTLNVGGGGVACGAGNTHPTANTGNNGRGNWNKAAFVTNGQGTKFCLNGGTLSANNTGGNNLLSLNASGTHCNFCNNGAGAGDDPLNGSMGRITLWTQELTQGQMQEYTSLTNPYDSYP